MEDANAELEDGVLVRERGEDCCWVEASCCNPSCRGVKDAVDEEAEELCRLLFVLLV